MVTITPQQKLEAYKYCLEQKKQYDTGLHLLPLCYSISDFFEINGFNKIDALEIPYSHFIEIHSEINKQGGFGYLDKEYRLPFVLSQIELLEKQLIP